MSDPLNFFTSTLEPVKLPSDDAPLSLLPLLPPSAAAFQLPEQPQPTGEDFMKNLQLQINQLPKSNIEYTFGEPEKKRYDNPVLSYIPADRLVNAKDIEELYSINQGAGVQLGNGLVKALGNTAGTFASTFLSIPSNIDLFRQGQYIEAFNNDSLFGSIQESLKNLEDTFPNYYTMAERENPWKGIVPFTAGSANFWGDKVIKNIGFSMGALGAGVVIDAGLTAVTLGGYSELAALRTLNNIRRFGNNMFRGFRNTVKIAQSASAARSLGAAYTTSKNLIESARTLSHAQALTKLPKWAATTYLTAQGEAFIEGYHNYADIKAKGIEKALREGTSIESDLEARAQAAGKYTTAFNMPVIMLSNMLQFSNVLYGQAARVGVPKNWIKIINEGGLQVTNNYTWKKGMAEFFKSSGKDFATEFMEEGSQVMIGNSIMDYYSDKKNYEARKSVLGHIIHQIPKNLTDQDFWFEGVIGGLTGALMGLKGNARYMFKGRQDAQDIVDSMNPVLHRFNGLVKNFNHQILLNNTIDKRAEQDIKFKSMYSVVSDNSRQGTYEIFQDALEDLKALDLNQFNNAFGTEFKTDGEKIQHIQDILNQADNIKKNIDLVNQMYSENPYVTKSTLGNFVKKFFPDADQNQLAYLFEEFKENIGYTMSRLQHTKEREGQLNVYFREVLDPKIDEAGFKSVLGYFMAVSAKGDKRPYIAWKEVQKMGLQEQLAYYEELISQTGATRDVRNQKKAIENRIAEIEKHIKKIETLSDKNEVLTELFTENVSVGGFQEFSEKLKEYQRNVSEKENLEKEAQDPESTAKATAAAEAMADAQARQDAKKPPVARQDSDDQEADEELDEDEEVAFTGRAPRRGPSRPPSPPPPSNVPSDIDTATKEKLFPIGSLHRGKKSGDLYEVIGYDDDKVIFTITKSDGPTAKESIPFEDLKIGIRDGSIIYNLKGSPQPQAPPSSTSDAKTDIEQESTPGDYAKVLQLVRDIIAGKKIDTPEQLQLHNNYPKLFEEYMKIEKERQEKLDKVGEEVLPKEVQEFITIDNSGGKVKPKYTPVPRKDLKTILAAWFERNIPDVIIGSIKFNVDAFDVEIKIKGIKNFQKWSLPIISTVGGTGQFIESNLSEWGKTLINAKYDAELAALKGKQTTPSDAKTDIESKTKEELFPIDSLHKGQESGDTLKVIGYTTDGVRFEIQTEALVKPTKNFIFSELKRLIKEGKLISDVYANLATTKTQTSASGTPGTTSVAVWTYQDILEYLNDLANQPKSGTPKITVTEKSTLNPEGRTFTLELNQGSILEIINSTEGVHYAPPPEGLNPVYEVDSTKYKKKDDPQTTNITNDIINFMQEYHTKYPNIANALSQTKFFIVQC